MQAQISPTVQAVLSRVDALAAKLGILAGQVWGFYVREVRVEAIRDTALGVVLALVGLSLLKYVSPYIWKKGQEPYADDVGWTVLTGLSIIAAVVVLGIAVNLFYIAIPEWFNPQYVAFQQLVSDLK